MELCDKLAAVSRQRSGTKGVVLGTDDLSDPATLQEVQRKLWESLKDLIPVDEEGKKTDNREHLALATASGHLL
jgi:hypothetical protein